MYRNTGFFKGLEIMHKVITKKQPIKKQTKQKSLPQHNNNRRTKTAK